MAVGGLRDLDQRRKKRNSGSALSSSRVGRRPGGKSPQAKMSQGSNYGTGGTPARPRKSQPAVDASLPGPSQPERVNQSRTSPGVKRGQLGRQGFNALRSQAAPGGEASSGGMGSRMADNLQQFLSRPASASAINAARERVRSIPTSVTEGMPQYTPEMARDLAEAKQAAAGRFDALNQGVRERTNSLQQRAGRSAANADRMESFMEKERPPRNEAGSRLSGGVFGPYGARDAASFQEMAGAEAARRTAADREWDENFERFSRENPNSVVPTESSQMATKHNLFRRAVGGRPMDHEEFVSFYNANPEEVEGAIDLLRDERREQRAQKAERQAEGMEALRQRARDESQAQGMAASMIARGVPPAQAANVAAAEIGRARMARAIEDQRAAEMGLEELRQGSETERAQIQGDAMVDSERAMAAARENVARTQGETAREIAAMQDATSQRGQELERDLAEMKLEALNAQTPQDRMDLYERVQSRNPYAAAETARQQSMAVAQSENPNLTLRELNQIGEDAASIAFEASRPIWSAISQDPGLRQFTGVGQVPVSDDGSPVSVGDGMPERSEIQNPFRSRGAEGTVSPDGFEPMRPATRDEVMAAHDSEYAWRGRTPTPEEVKKKLAHQGLRLTDDVAYVGFMDNLFRGMGGMAPYDDHSVWGDETDVAKSRAQLFRRQFPESDLGQRADRFLELSGDRR